jgi:hypothetical protein
MQAYLTTQKYEGSCATGHRAKGGLEEESSKMNGQPMLVGKICQDNKLMMMINTET